MKYEITLKYGSGGAIKAMATDMLVDMPYAKMLVAEGPTIRTVLAELAELIEDRERGKVKA